MSFTTREAENSEWIWMDCKCWFGVAYCNFKQMVQWTFCIWKASLTVYSLILQQFSFSFQDTATLEQGCLFKVDEYGFFIYWKSEGKVGVNKAVSSCVLLAIYQTWLHQDMYPSRFLTKLRFISRQAMKSIWSSRVLLPGHCIAHSQKQISTFQML